MKYLIIGFLIILIVLYTMYRFPTQNQLTAHTAKALVITCMDFRLIDDAVYFLNSIGYNNNYDEIILAGASLGYNQTKYEYWKKTVNDHIDLAKNLHHIEKIIIIDHMNCGAYKIFYNKPNISVEEELALHKENFNKFKNLINDLYPELKVLTYLMGIDGNIINY
jgi:carbonic anhydrase